MRVTSLGRGWRGVARSRAPAVSDRDGVVVAVGRHVVRAERGEPRGLATGAARRLSRQHRRLPQPDGRPLALGVDAAIEQHLPGDGAEGGRRHLAAVVLAALRLGDRHHPHQGRPVRRREADEARQVAASSRRARGSAPSRSCPPPGSRGPRRTCPVPSMTTPSIRRVARAPWPGEIGRPTTGGAGYFGTRASPRLTAATMCGRSSAPPLATAAVARGELQRRHRDPLPEGDVGPWRAGLQRSDGCRMPALSPGRSIPGRPAEAEAADGAVEPLARPSAGRPG